MPPPAIPFMTGFKMTPIRSVIVVVLFSIVGGLFADRPVSQIGPPWGFVFNGWMGPPLDVIVYIPGKARTSTPVLLVIPGASRDAQRFHASWLDLAKKKGFIVVTIGATKEHFPDEYSYNAGWVISKKGDPEHEDRWLFSAIEPLFKNVKERYGLSADGFYLFGHSAGGGFVHRYLLFKPDAPVFRAVAANPAFVTLPDRDVDYPFGIKNTRIQDSDIEKWVGHKLAVILGEEDLGPRTKPLSNGPKAREQGPHCFARGQLLFNTAKEESKKKNTRFGWTLITVPNVGHDNLRLVPYASDYLFGK